MRLSLQVVVEVDEAIGALLLSSNKGMLRDLWPDDEVAAAIGCVEGVFAAEVEEIEEGS